MQFLSRKRIKIQQNNKQNYLKLGLIKQRIINSSKKISYTKER